MGNKKSVQKYLNQNKVWDQDYAKLNKELIATNKFLEDPNFPPPKVILCDHDYEDGSIAKEIESGKFTEERSVGVSGEISKVGDVPDFDSDRKLFKVLRKAVNDKAFIGASPKVRTHNFSNSAGTYLHCDILCFSLYARPKCLIQSF